MSIRALFIDLDGVLRRWPDSDEALEQAHGLPAGTLRRTAFAPELLLPAITGQISDEAWRANIAARLGEAHHGLDAGEVTRQWSEPAGKVDLEVVSLLQARRPDLKLILLSNATSRLDADLRHLGIATLFDQVINSSALGVVKPDPAIYRAALRLARVEASEAAFIDDSIGNVEAAVQLGIRSHCFRSAPHLRIFLQSIQALQPDGAPADSDRGAQG